MGTARGSSSCRLPVHAPIRPNGGIPTTIDVLRPPTGTTQTTIPTYAASHDATTAPDGSGLRHHAAETRPDALHAKRLPGRSGHARLRELHASEDAASSRGAISADAPSNVKPGDESADPTVQSYDAFGAYATAANGSAADSAESDTVAASNDTADDATSDGNTAIRSETRGTDWKRESSVSRSVPAIITTDFTEASDVAEAASVAQTGYVACET